MLLETLLLSPCFSPGKTSHKDSKTTIFVDKNELNKNNDETLLFFDIDNQTNACCKLRDLFWGKNEKHKLCDLLVFYAKGNDTRVFCFVELKDNLNDFGKATEQIISTYNAFKEKLVPQFANKYTAKAFIFGSRNKLPENHQKYKNNLKSKFGENFEPDGNSEKFLNFLRGENAKTPKKGQKRR